jgi:hypothetical protein
MKTCKQVRASCPISWNDLISTLENPEVEFEVPGRTSSLDKYGTHKYILFTQNVFVSRVRPIHGKT